MSVKGELAEKYFRDGYNCAQSITCAFSDEIGLNVDKAAKLASGFGGGFGRLREVCGAVSGGVMILSTLCGYNDLTNAEAKKQTYAMIQDFMKRFETKCGSYVCKELISDCSHNTDNLPKNTSERTEEYYKKRPCNELCHISADIVFEILTEQKAI